jgi:hypothetical protein
MTKKTIPFRIPQKASAAPGPSTEAAAPDQWVHQSEQPAEVLAPGAAPGVATPAPALTVTFSADPNVFDAWKMMLLPYALGWRWALGAAHKHAEGLTK